MAPLCVALTTVVDIVCHGGLLTARRDQRRGAAICIERRCEYVKRRMGRGAALQ
jgi:hypothetical protein